MEYFVSIGGMALGIGVILLLEMIERKRGIYEE